MVTILSQPQCINNKLICIQNDGQQPHDIFINTKIVVELIQQISPPIYLTISNSVYQFEIIVMRVLLYHIRVCEKGWEILQVRSVVDRYP